MMLYGRTTLPSDFEIFSLIAQPEAVADDALRQLDAGGHQERRPVDGVEADDVLADQVDVRRPVAGRTVSWSALPKPSAEM